MEDQLNTQIIHASVTNLLGDVIKPLSIFLEAALPSLFDDWWNKAVVSKLSFQQRRRIEQRGIDSLASLDLAALLRVLDQNWYQVSTKLNISSESRHFVKEMQTIRNRWAHAGAEGFPIEDIYRDLDTLQRFSVVVNGGESMLQDIRVAKASLLATEPQVGDSISNGEQTFEEKEPSTEFSPGQIVILKSNPSTRGAVVSIVRGEPENRYNVFIDGETQTFYSSQIKIEDRKKLDFRFLPCNQFHSYLTALQIRNPGLSTLYSLNAARIDFIPYQFRPVLKFIRSDRPRLLIADGVGVGKTIEAGLVLRELQARRDVRSVLIICPRPLVVERKWQIEMKRFEERFSHLDGTTLRYCVNEMDLEGVWPDQYHKVIVPYSMFDETLLYGTGIEAKKKRKKGLLNLDPPPRFDLVIVDEAHHIRNTDTYSHKAVRFFCDHAEAVIFLTATPIQLGSNDLFVLLNTLRPDLIIDKDSFEQMAAPNPFINRAVAIAREKEPGWAVRAAETLDEAGSTAWGHAVLRHNPEFTRICNQLTHESISLDDRVKLISDLEALHTFDGIINRTRRRDIGDFTIRKPETVVVEFTPSQKEFHDDLLEVQAEIHSRIHQHINVNFLMTTIRRQASSCLYGLAPLLQDILNRHIDELFWGEADNSLTAPFEVPIETIEVKIQEILERSQNLDSNDPKLDALRKILKNKQELPNNKVMLFSSFRHTLSYLYQHLKADAYRVGMVHGGTPDEERVELRNRFELGSEHADAIDILLFSEIGCEGLDYQFCNCIVNYDLPWNPMRIEQRIGRIDRWGQKSESVVIFNFITPGTVDADIYERCLMRIGVFESALGGSEEILGEISKEIRNIAENFTLSAEERREKLQQLADNQIRLIQEQEALEQKQVELFGIRLPEAQLKEEIDEASSFWLSPPSIYNLIKLYLKKICTTERESILGEKPLKTLRLSQQARSRLLADLHKLPRQNISLYRDWENWLKGGDPHLLITFDTICASQHPEATLVTPLHPLVRQASRTLEIRARVITALKVEDEAAQAGSYKFAIYQWQFHGIREDINLIPIADSKQVTSNLSKLLEKAEEDPVSKENVPDLSTWNELETHHYDIWSKAREDHQRRTGELVRYRRESLAASHRARISLLEEQHDQANDDKIRRMRQSQIASAEADYARRIQGLDIAMERADITAQPVGYGILNISGGVGNA